MGHLEQVEKAQLQLLGGFSLLYAGQDLTPRPRKARALLGFLALRPRGATRSRLSQLLWGDVPESQGRSSLRQSLRAIRKALGEQEGWLITEEDNIRLDSTALSVDVKQLCSVSRNAELEELLEALELYRGTLLEGLCREEAAFEHFRIAEQETTRDQVECLMTRAVEAFRKKGDEANALKQALALVNVDWTRESAHGLVLEGYARTGQLAAARGHYQRFKEQLETNLGMKPGDALRTTYESLSSFTPRASVEKDEARPEPLRRRQTCAVYVTPTLDTDLAPEDRYAQLSAFWQLAKDALAGHGADESHPDGDGLLALWGTNQLRGDEGRRALRGAELLQKDLKDSGAFTCCRVGAACGLLVPAPGMSPPWIGAALSEARSLALAAPSCDPALSEELAHSLGLGDETPWVGRERELDEIRRLLDRVRDTGRGSLVLVRGDAGIGKTRFCDRVSELAEASSMKVVRLHVAEFGEGDQRDLGGALARALALLMTGKEHLDEEAGQLLDEESSERLRLLLGLPTDEATRNEEAAMVGEMRSLRRRETLLELLREVASRHRLLWLLEDAHWATPSELADIAEMWDQVSDLPLLCLATVRTEAEPELPEWRAALHRSGVSRIELGPLEDSAAHRLANAHAKVPPEVRTRLVERAAGNPLFLEQLLRRAAQGGKLDDIPSTIQAVVVARIDRESPEHRSALELAAVVGQRMHRDTLFELIGRGCVTHLREAGFLEADGLYLRFSHALIRDAIYSVIHQSKRQELHQQAADFYAERDRLRQAEHLSEAKSEHAAEAFLRAAEDAIRDGWIAQALEHVKKGLSHPAPPTVRGQLLVQRAHLERQLGLIEEALSSYEVARAESICPENKLAAYLGQAETLATADRLNAAFFVLGQAEKLLEAAPDALWAARIFTLRGNFHFPSGNHRACITAHRRALELAREAKESASESSSSAGQDSQSAEARALSGLADAEYMRGNLEGATELFTEVMSVADGPSGKVARLMAQAMRGLIGAFRGKFDEAEQDLTEALRVAEKTGIIRALLVVHSGLSLVAQGRSDDALNVLHSGLATTFARRLGAKRFEGLAAGYGIRSRLKNESREEVFLDVCAIKDRCLGHSEDFWLAGCLGALAHAGESKAERRELVEAGRKALQPHSPIHNHVTFYAEAIDVLLRDGEQERARELADDYEAHTKEHPFFAAQQAISAARAAAN